MKNVACQKAQICTINGLSQASDCHWQLPYCLTRKGVHFISIEGKTGRTSAVYNILIYLQRPESVAQNVLFNPQNLTGTANPTLEANVTHDYTHQPNGWSQFIRLSDVLVQDRDLEGDILEVFFYRVQNNPGVSIAFNAYLYPQDPAGPRTCCDGNPAYTAACQGFPCLSHVPTTTSTSTQLDAVASTTCYSGQLGTGANPSNPFPGPFACVLTVWGCDLNKYHPNNSNNTADWWLTVVPVDGTSPSGSPSLPGLSYSVAWRVRNVRRNGVNGTVTDQTTLDITNQINSVATTDGYTPVFSFSQFQDFRSYSFVVSNDTASRRLIVQTDFAPTFLGAVYLRSAKNAGPLDCNSYFCPTASTNGSSASCNAGGRYVNSYCSLTAGTYYLSVRNLDASNSLLSYRFRITILSIPTTTVIPAGPTANSPYITSVADTVGVQGENYNYYRLDISESDINDHQSLNILLSRSNNTNAGNLQLLFRLGQLPGIYRVANENFLDSGSNPQAEDCGTYQYSCTASTTNCCRLQIPACQLIAGSWYIGVYNAVFNFAGTQPEALLGYTLQTYFDLPPVNLTVQFSPATTSYSNSITTSCNTPYYVHHRFTVTEDELQFYNRNTTDSYYNRYLRIQVTNVTNTPVFYINYDDLAGSSSDYWCLANFASSTCGVNGCLYDITPCGNPKLITGDYYVSLKFPGASTSTYTIVVTIEDLPFQELTPVIVPHFRDPTDGSNAIWTAITNSSVAANSTYYYVLDTESVDNSEDDDVSGDTYMLGVLSVLSTEANPNVVLNVWRDDCTRWKCSVNTLQGNCVIDALELAPCSVHGGRYYVRIDNFGLAASIQFNWYWNTTFKATVADKQTLSDTIYSHEYQEYFFQATNVGLGSTLAVNIISSCGNLEAWIRPNEYAGPGPDASDIRTSCYIDYCATTKTNNLSVFGGTAYSCQLFLDTCNYQQTGYWIALRGDTTSFYNVVFGFQNATTVPIYYTIQPVQTHVVFQAIPSIGTQVETTYQQSWTTSPKQYVVDVSTMPYGSALRFVMTVPIEAYVANSKATLHVHVNTPVGYTTQCPDNVGNNTQYVGTCTVNNADTSLVGRSCVIFLDGCRVQRNLRNVYYIWADAPRGTVLVVERYIPVVKTILPGDVDQATVSADLPLSVVDTIYSGPWRTNFQLYIVQIDPRSQDFHFRALLYGIQNADAVTMYVNDGQYPYATAQSDSGCTVPALFKSCPAPAQGPTVPGRHKHEINCTIDIGRCDLVRQVPAVSEELCANQFLEDPKCTGDCAFICGRTAPTKLWITVVGTQQTCELHSIPYSLRVTTKGNTHRVAVNQEFCGEVNENQYQWYQVIPKQNIITSDPSIMTITRFTVRNVVTPGQVSLFIQDGFLPTTGTTGTVYPYNPQCNLQTALTTTTADYGTATFDWICAFGRDESTRSRFTATSEGEEFGLIAGVFGVQAADDDDDETNDDDDQQILPRTINFSMNVSSIPVKVRLLDEGVTFDVDDEDDTCPHAHDYYRYTSRNVKDGYLQVTVSSPGSYTVYANKGGLAWGPCSNVNYLKQSGVGYIFDYCGFEPNTDYFFTVVASTTYTISAITVATTQQISLNVPFNDDIPLVPPTRFYKLDLSSKDFDDQSRLVVTVDNVQYASVNVAIRYGALPGPKSFVYNTSPSWCSINQESTQFVTANYPPSGVDTAYTDVTVQADCLQAGTYYIYVSAVPTSTRVNHVEFTVTATIEKLGIDITDLTTDQKFKDTVDIYNVNRVSDFEQLPRYNYYRVSTSQNMGTVRVLNVQNGYVTLLAHEGRLITSKKAFVDGSIAHLSNAQNHRIFHGTRPLVEQSLLHDDSSFFGCFTSPSVVQPAQYQEYTSCAIALDHCHYDSGSYYFVVYPTSQFYEEHPITYEIEFDDLNPTVLESGVATEKGFTSGNWQYAFYSFSQAHVASAVISVKVSLGEGVLLNLYNNPCPTCATWSESMWCASDGAETGGFICKFEIPTRPDHPGTTDFYLTAYAKDATFFIQYTEARANCHEFSGTGVAEGLSFCKGLPYATWVVDDYAALDGEAEALFTELYNEFKVQPCWSGVTPECNSTLNRFACYETFRRCDEKGFQVPTCRKACDNVVYQCVNYFESVNLEAYNCTSDRYLDSELYTCTGNHEDGVYGEDGYFLNVDDILFRPQIIAAAGKHEISFVLSTILLAVLLLLAL